MIFFRKPKTKILSHPGEGSSVLTHTFTPLYEHKIAKEHHDFIRDLARNFDSIVEARGLFGALRDDSALTYWQGASRALLQLGMSSLSEDVAKIGVLEISPRGYQAILELSK